MAATDRLPPSTASWTGKHTSTVVRSTSFHAQLRSAPRKPRFYHNARYLETHRCARIEFLLQRALRKFPCRTGCYHLSRLAVCPLNPRSDALTWIGIISCMPCLNFVKNLPCPGPRPLRDLEVKTTAKLRSHVWVMYVLREYF